MATRTGRGGVGERDELTRDMRRTLQHPGPQSTEPDPRSASWPRPEIRQRPTRTGVPLRGGTEAYNSDGVGVDPPPAKHAIPPAARRRQAKTTANAPPKITPTPHTSLYPKHPTEAGWEGTPP